MDNTISISSKSPNNFIVYKHTNNQNNKVYIGITHSNPKRRWLNGNGYKNNEHFWSAIQKYGWNNFTHEIVAENLSEKEALLLEENLIRKYDSTNQEKGYNHLLSSMNKHPHFTEEDKLKIGKSYKEYFSNLTPEEYLHFRELHKECSNTEKAKRNMSIGQKKRFREESEEDKEIRKEKHRKAALRNKDKISAGVRNHLDNMTEEDWKKRSEILKRAFSTPEAKKNMSEGHKRGLNTPEALKRKEKKSLIYKKMLSEGKFSGKNSWNEFSNWYSKNKENL